jgi:hypothetical protein
VGRSIRRAQPGGVPQRRQTYAYPSRLSRRDNANHFTPHTRHTKAREVCSQQKWRCLESPYIFVNGADEQMTPDGLDQMLYRLRDWSGISGERCSAHTFRHTFAVEFLRSMGDIYWLSRVLGHANVSTTEVYLRAVSSKDVRAGWRCSTICRGARTFHNAEPGEEVLSRAGWAG